ncbi:MAG: YbaN family protein [Thermoflexales bacterium]|nr:YbaN family protein [Thermoflexales bacterium]
MLKAIFSGQPLTAPVRLVLIAVGTLTLGLGILGTFLPGLPTTPFILVTLLCYARGSDRLYRWVLTRSWLQKPVRSALAFMECGALPVQVKAIAVSVAWGSAVLSVVTGAQMGVQLAVLGAAGASSLAMVLIKTWDGRVG